MTTVEVVNIKCGGCANKITKALEKIGAKNVIVNPMNQTISFDGIDQEAALKKLNHLGYPAANSEHAGSKVKKVQSYASCAVGRWGPHSE